MAAKKILVYLSDIQTSRMIERTALHPAGYAVTLVEDLSTFEALSQSSEPDAVLLGDRLPGAAAEEPLDGLELAARLLQGHPSLPVILVAEAPSDIQVIEAFRLGVSDYLSLPLHPSDVQQAVRGALQRRAWLQAWKHLEVNRNTRSLQDRLSGLEALEKIGRAVTSSLDLDSILTAVVEAAVELTGAEEGSLLLLDEATGELYMHAARNFQDEFVRTFRVPVADTLAGEVLRTGQPVILDESAPKKIKTTYLVHNLVYMPLVVAERTIGVLGIDNRTSGHAFTEYHLGLVSALASYAAIAIHNARLYARSEIERTKLGTILRRITDGVIVVDPAGRILLLNDSARGAFGVQDESPAGKPVKDVINSPDLLDVLEDERASAPFRSEIPLEDGRVFNAQVTPIPDVGLAVILQDITQLKELDRIKSDFVNAVSHDLRSPLTAILGYIELIERVGPITDQQQQFIRRVEQSVANITALINDLLDLGRIEAGFDSRKEIVPLGALVQHTLDGLRGHLEDKSQHLVVDVPEKLPPLLGNPVRLRQMLSNLIGNAFKYTQVSGEICVSARAEGEQVILQVSDNGPGIPLADQPYIFDKFYRASNIPPDAHGTGLGLAIVKSIVENHQGRIWVDSTPGRGSKFTVVLPAVDGGL